MVAVSWFSTIQACIVTGVHIFIFIFGLVYILRNLPSVPHIFCPCTVAWHMSTRNTSGEEVWWHVVKDVIHVLTRDRVSILDDLLSSPAQRYTEGSQTHQECAMWHKLSVS